jgi:hypothetical protein
MSNCLSIMKINFLHIEEIFFKKIIFIFNNYNLSALEIIFIVKNINILF